MRRASRTALAAVAACLLIASPSALAADGDLDADFDFDGFRTHNCGFSNAEGRTMALQPDGKILLLTRVMGGETDGPVCVTRLTATGALDRDFGTDGDVLLNEAGGAFANAIALQPDGRIVVGGAVSTGGQLDAIVYRLNSDGGTDNTFDGDGKTTLSFGASSDDTVTDVALQPDGRIVLAGRAIDGTGIHSGAARLTVDGALDTRFSGDGRTIETFGGPLDIPAAVALQGDRIVLAGVAQATGAEEQFGALRLNADGTRDLAFGPTGNGQIIVAPMGAGDSSAALDAIVTPDSGLLLTGTLNLAGGQTGGTSVAAVLKLDAGGRPDARFSGDGIQLVDFGGLSSAFAATLTIDGKYAIAGSLVDPPTKLATAKLTPAGALDPSFGNAGKQVYAGVPIAGRAIARQPNGKLLLAGNAGGAGVARIDDSLPFVGIAGGSTDEGQFVPFQIALSKTAGFPVTVNYITGEGTAKEGIDYVARSGSVTIPAGATGVALGITSLRDRLLEGTESLRVVLAGPSGAALGEEAGRGTIRNVLRSGRCVNLLIGLGRTDLLTGSRASDEIFGRTGDDFIAGLGGGDCLYGERGADEIDGGEGSDYVSGGAQDDTLRGGNGNDRLYGGRGRNSYSGGAGDDVILARNGKTEKIDCGPGRDSAKVDRTDRVRSCERVTRG